MNGNHGDTINFMVMEFAKLVRKWYKNISIIARIDRGFFDGEPLRGLILENIGLAASPGLTKHVSNLAHGLQIWMRFDKDEPFSQFC